MEIKWWWKKWNEFEIEDFWKVIFFGIRKSVNFLFDVLQKSKRNRIEQIY